MITKRHADVDGVIVRYEGDFELDDLEQRAEFALVKFREPVREQWQPVEQRCHVSQNGRFRRSPV